MDNLKTAFQCKYHSEKIRSNKMSKINPVKNTMFKTRHEYKFVAELTCNSFLKELKFRRFQVNKQSISNLCSFHRKTVWTKDVLQTETLWFPPEAGLRADSQTIWHMWKYQDLTATPDGQISNSLLSSESCQEMSGKQTPFPLLRSGLKLSFLIKLIVRDGSGDPETSHS